MSTKQQPVVADFEASEATQVELAGGKGAQLAALTRLAGIDVPPGFCVTTHAYRQAIASASGIEPLLARLAALTVDDRGAINRLGQALRGAIAAIDVPDDVALAIRAELGRLGDSDAYAVRSSATAEDSATSSFAGQHGTFLNVTGIDAVVNHVRLCWASLFTDQAITYRLGAGIAQRDAAMAVVVQRMVPAQAAGVLFTADPISGNRRVAAIEAVRGLGEALVSGRVIPDGFQVREGEITSRSLAGASAVLTDDQLRRLADLGRHIERGLGGPQDIEWCLAGDAFAVVQSRPITTLFPIPDGAAGCPHVYVSVGHQQMMTDPMKPLGLSLWQLTAMPTMHEAAGRLFVDVADRLASRAGRDAVVSMLGQGDPLIGDALRTVVERGFIPLAPDQALSTGPRPSSGLQPQELLPADPAIVEELVASAEASLAMLERDLTGLTGPALFDFILADIQKLKAMTFAPRSMQVIMSGMAATRWLSEQLEAWLGETSAADTLAQSVPGNVTSEMGLDLLDVADVIREHPAVVAYLEDGVDDGFLDELPRLPGGRAARDAISAYLERYGMRCVGEIDITRPRWSERPSALVPAILGNVRSFAPGAGPRRFAQGREQAAAHARDLLRRLRALPDGGEEKADEAAAMIERLRTFSGYREFPKYAIVCRFFSYKRALMAEADRLVDAGVLRTPDDCFFLRFDEFHGAAGGEEVDWRLIDERRAAFRWWQTLTPPRVMTSEGEAVAGSYRRGDVPTGALVGLAVSAGTVEGRARVVVDLADAVFEPGDILVTRFTDPSWTPAFIAISGLVTEVGGLMTHGAVIAREYGLPAVVGVELATQRVRDGQRIRVHGTDGFVELLA